MAEIRIKVWVLVVGLTGAVLGCLLCLLLGAGATFYYLRVAAPVRPRPPIRPPPRVALAEPQFEPVTRGTASVEAGDLINVSFAGEKSKQGKAAIGNNADDFWNHYHFPFATQATLDDLKTIAGRPTGLLLQSRNLSGEWGFSSPDPMWGAFSYSETDQGYLRFPNLPPGSYELYLFLHSAGDPNPAKDWELSGRAQVKAGRKDYGVRSTQASPDFLSTEWKEGIHYVVFRDLELPPAATLNITLLRGGNNAKPAINGLQLRRVR